MNQYVQLTCIGNNYGWWKRNSFASSYQKFAKPLLKINQKPILAWIIELLWEHQITDISVSVSYLAESIIEFLRGDESMLLSKFLQKKPLLMTLEF